MKTTFYTRDVQCRENSPARTVAPSKTIGPARGIPGGHGGEGDQAVVAVCGGARGCPRAVGDVAGARERMVALLDEAGPEPARPQAPGGLLTHQRLRLSVSGCANACSQPQIADLGLIARAFPSLLPDVCVSCGACVEMCVERALSLGPGDWPLITTGAWAAARVYPRARWQRWPRANPAGVCSSVGGWDAIPAWPSR